jgi:hypothetical protein
MTDGAAGPLESEDGADLPHLRAGAGEQADDLFMEDEEEGEADELAQAGLGRLVERLDSEDGEGEDLFGDEMDR